MKQQRYPAYIAILTAIILSSLIMVMSVTIAFVSLTARLATEDLTLKGMTIEGGRACLEQALLKLSLNSDYAGNETIQITNPGQNETTRIINSGQNVVTQVINSGQTVTCVIKPIIDNGGGYKVISVKSTIAALTNETPVTNLVLTVDATKLTTISLKEVPVL